MADGASLDGNGNIAVTVKASCQKPLDLSSCFEDVVAFKAIIIDICPVVMAIQDTSMELSDRNWLNLNTRTSFHPYRHLYTMEKVSDRPEEGSR